MERGIQGLLRGLVLLQIETRKFGAYLINYFVNVATSTDTNYVIQVKTRDYNVPSSKVKVEEKANFISGATGSSIFALTEDDEVTLTITSENDTELIFDDNTNAMLNIIKLDQWINKQVMNVLICFLNIYNNMGLYIFLAKQ